MDNPMWRKNCKNNKELMPNLSASQKKKKKKKKKKNLSALNLANEEKGVNF